MTVYTTSIDFKVDHKTKDDKENEEVARRIAIAIGDAACAAGYKAGAHYVEAQPFDKLFDVY